MSGQYVPVEPLDYLLMREMPDEGTTLAGIYPIGTSVKELKVKYPMLTSDQISARVRVLGLFGLNTKKRGVGGGSHSVYQLTAKGKALLKEWEAKQPLPQTPDTTEQTNDEQGEGTPQEI